MKIPETSANVGAYYGNEENGQWQPNGVIIDSGPGGGVVGSGDAGHHRPPVYPVHVPRPHIPGYVMGGVGAYYVGGGAAPLGAPQPQPPDFADYMWMENEEEFDKQVMQQLEEEALMEQCIEAMLEDEQREQRHRPQNGHNQHYPTTSNGGGSLSLAETVSRSTLNPLAAEFVPTRRGADDKVESPAEGASGTESADTDKTEPSDVTHADAEPEVAEHRKTDVEHPQQCETPEVSAADLQTDKPRPKDKKELKKQAAKPDAKKTKPQAVKSDTKVQPKKQEVKSVKSEVKVEEKSEEVTTEVVKPQPAPAEEPQTGPKPINYAAAARNNKPKKQPTTPPPTAPIDKMAPKITDKKPIDKTKPKDKPAPRKNSAK